MAILTFSQAAPLSGFWSWMQQRNLQTLCAPAGSEQFAVLLKRMTPGTRAQAGDTVRMSAFLASGTAVINYGGQWMDDAGEYRRYNRTLTVTSGTSPQRITIPASEGWYRDAAVSLETAGITGQTLYVTQELGRPNGGGYAPFAMLAQGWLTSTAPVTDIRPPLPDTSGGGTGGGCCLATTYSDIVTGNHSNSYTITPGAGQVGRVTYFETNLTTDATIVVRHPYLEIQVGGSSPFFSIPNKTQGPGVLYGYAWQLGGTPRDDTDGKVYYDLLPADLWFSEPFDVRFLVAHDAVGDSVGTATIFYELKGP